MKILCVLALFGAFQSCTIHGPVRQNSSSKQAVPLVYAAKNTDDAQKKSSEANAELSSQTAHTAASLLADINSAYDANGGNPEGNPKTIVAGDLTVAKGRLKDVAPDPLEVAAAAQRRALVESGKVKDAQKAYEEAAQKAKDQAVQLEALKTKADQLDRDLASARAFEATERANFLATIEQNRIDAEAKIKKAQDDANNEVLHKQVLYLNIGGAACVLVFGLCAGFGGLAGLRISWPFGALALICFGLAQIVSQWWFKWAIGGSTLVFIGVVIYWLRQHLKAGDLAAAAMEKSEQAQSVLSKVVPQLDNAYDAASSDVQTFLDDKIFTPLSKNIMTAVDKATVHQVRAANAVASK